MIKYGLRETRISMGIFDFDIICVVGGYENLKKYLNWKFEDDLKITETTRGYEARGQCHYKTGYVPVIWLPQLPKSSREHATLAHECIHAVYHLFDWAGIPIDRSTEEVFAHATAHIINEILKPNFTRKER